MLYTIAIILLVMWALGLVSSYMIGGFIHLLLVVALAWSWLTSSPAAADGCPDEW